MLTLERNGGQSGMAEGTVYQGLRDAGRVARSLRRGRRPPSSAGQLSAYACVVLTGQQSQGIEQSVVARGVSRDC